MTPMKISQGILFLLSGNFLLFFFYFFASLDKGSVFKGFVNDLVRAACQARFYVFYFYFALRDCFRVRDDFFTVGSFCGLEPRFLKSSDNCLCKLSAGSMRRLAASETCE
jgi:hypothetical protein